MPEEIVKELYEIIPTLVYFALGVVLFYLAIKIAEKLTPFSIRKEIEEDQNTSLGIIIGAGLISIAIIIAAIIG